MALQRVPLLNEFTAPPIRLEDYVRRPEWASLPMQIKVAVVHLWRAEHDLSTATAKATQAGAADVG
jgi:hypothetical protein